MDPPCTPTRALPLLSLRRPRTKSSWQMPEPPRISSYDERILPKSLLYMLRLKSLVAMPPPPKARPGSATGKITTSPFNEHNSGLVWAESLRQAREMLQVWLSKSDEGITGTAEDIPSRQNRVHGRGDGLQAF